MYLYKGSRQFGAFSRVIIISEDSNLPSISL